MSHSITWLETLKLHEPSQSLVVLTKIVETDGGDNGRC